MLVNLLYSIYQDPFDEYKARSMNTIIEDRLPLMLKLGLSVPDYVTSGEKFIDYMNRLTDNKVPYEMNAN
ncbi:MAG: hypothetical protein NC048_06420 [Bacteroides sp.]|nr:hypothetical protein [Ruminococcus flavefaciens]MCM1555112.1 hypothetical protein [Bacteroides sp.]